MLVGAAPNLLDHLARIGERLFHQLGVGDLFGDALREELESAPQASSAAFWLGAAT